MSKPRAIVPLWRPETHEPSELYDPNVPQKAAQAHLTYRGGPLLTNVQIVPIFWGSQWQSDVALSQLRVELLGFLRFFVAADGPMLQQLAEYSVPGQTIGPGTVLPDVQSAKPHWSASVTDRAIQATLKRGTLHTLIPAPTPNTLYVLYLQPGLIVVDGPDRSCEVFCGFHSVTSGKGLNLFYAVLPFPSCSGCLGGLSTLNALTSVSSHEIAEAITDAVPGQGWYDDQNGEIGDIAAWQQGGNSTWVWQLEWSNAQGKGI